MFMTDFIQDIKKEFILSLVLCYKTYTKLESIGEEHVREQAHMGERVSREGGWFPPLMAFLFKIVLLAFSSIFAIVYILLSPVRVLMQKYMFFKIFFFSILVLPFLFLKYIYMQTGIGVDTVFEYMTVNLTPRMVDQFVGFIVVLVILLCASTFIFFYHLRKIRNSYPHSV